MRHEQRSVCYFNNCHNRNHVELFGRRAFFDLSNIGTQASLARDLMPGQLCVVGSYGDSGEVVFGWYEFGQESLLPYQEGAVRVFFGRHLHAEGLMKSAAASSSRYSALFKRTGAFKQGSVFWDDIALGDLPLEVGRSESDVSDEQGVRNGACFGDPAENPLVEAAAIRAVVKQYKDDGWGVKSVERDRCGFDLICSRNGVVQNVEVKGVRGVEVSFIITAGEVGRASWDPDFVLAVVTEALTSKKIARYSANEFRRGFKLSPLQYRAELRRA